jgi:peptide-methionine (S)-S-oxide reductase
MNKKALFLILVLGMISFLFSGHGLSLQAEENPKSGTSKTEVATFAGGCFWCMVPPFKKLEGVLSVTSGYTGGHLENPRYEQVSAGGTGHAESVEIIYDPQKISYQKLLDVFWHNVDPTTIDRQFCDTGNQYRSEIFYHSDQQRRWAEESKSALEKTKPFKETLVTQINPASKFYPAEEYHQNFFSKNPLRYQFYRHRCGRDQRLKELWGSSAPAH